jgi:hypothetical protein
MNRLHGGSFVIRHSFKFSVEVAGSVILLIVTAVLELCAQDGSNVLDLAPVGQPNPLPFAFVVVPLLDSDPTDQHAIRPVMGWRCAHKLIVMDEPNGVKRFALIILAL